MSVCSYWRACRKLSRHGSRRRRTGASSSDPLFHSEMRFNHQRAGGTNMQDILGRDTDFDRSLDQMEELAEKAGEDLEEIEADIEDDDLDDEDWDDEDWDEDEDEEDDEDFFADDDEDWE